MVLYMKWPCRCGSWQYVKNLANVKWLAKWQWENQDLESRREQHSYSSWCFSCREVCGWRHCKHCPNQTESVALGYRPAPLRQTSHQICPTCNKWFTLLDWLKRGWHGKLLPIKIMVFLGGWLFLFNPRWCAIFI